MHYIDIIGYIASFFTAIVGLPLVINTFIAKQPPKTSLLSWWIYYIGIFFFTLLGLALYDLPLFITQVFCGLITLVFLIQVYTYKLKTEKKKGENLAFIGAGILVYLVILLLFIFYLAEIVPAGQIISAASYLGIIAGFCVNFAFLPQTILGIKQKTIKFIPLTFLVNLATLNIFWIIYEFLQILVNNDNNWLTALIFQIIGLAIATIQILVFFFQLIQQRKTEANFKINWI
ncbi:hypothetical protein [Mesomycoplasma hyopneumoniae]|uniref:hypothetical protein n=1 Tax=Mesomycoplasma hyopneumoniae TaxID=2099 RepID=UPI0015C5CC41|nr:hypothetical protein [Mesomycoplasma hyopneumoniae]QLG43554.1 hypothetical protein HZK19_02590 [Mesomycoplasma hyopneumoniae]